MRKIIQSEKFIKNALQVIKMWKFRSITLVRVSTLDVMGVNKEKENISTIFSFASKHALPPALTHQTSANSFPKPQP